MASRYGIEVRCNQTPKDLLLKDSGERFCTQCDQTILDLRLASQKEIHDFLASENRFTTCVIAREEDLNKPLPKSKTNYKWALPFSLLALASSGEVLGHGAFGTEQVENINLGPIIPKSNRLTEVKGIVKDEGGNPVIFVPVVIEGANCSVMTDLDGCFSLLVPDSVFKEQHFLVIKTWDYLEYREALPLKPNEGLFYEIQLVGDSGICTEIIGLIVDEFPQSSPLENVIKVSSPKYWYRKLYWKMAAWLGKEYL